MDIISKIHELKVVPVVVLNSVDEVETKIGGLVEGKLPVAEITFRTPCAAAAIKKSLELYPDALIGAGTVINASQCEEALKAGAKFIVSPGFADDVDSVCKAHNVPYLPGIATPTEIIHAISLGHKIVKFFPASNYGGLKTIKSLAAVFPDIKFLPTGGINEDSYLEYLAFDKIIAVGGSWMTKGTHEEIVKMCLRIHDGK